MTAIVLFVCPHGAAKSVLAAAYFQARVDQLGWPYRAMSAGAEPDTALSPAVVAQLRAEGLPVPRHAPRRVGDAELAAAERVVVFGCDVRGRVRLDTPVDDWADVPALSEDFETAREAIRARVEQLVNKLASPKD